MLNLRRGTYYYQAGRLTLDEKYAHARKNIEAVIDKDPKYGYRRIYDALKTDHQRLINHKPLQKLLRHWDLALKRAVKRPRPSGIAVILKDLGPRANLLMRMAEEEIEPLKLYQTDFTEIVARCGKIFLIVFLDHKSKVVAGAAVGLRADTPLAKAAYAEMKRFLKQHEISPKDIIVHQDQGGPFISYEYVGALVSDDVTPSYSRVGTPGDNAEMESFFGRFKSDWSDVFATARDMTELNELVWEAIRYYNHERIHSRTNGTSPLNNLPTILRQ